MSSSTSGMKYSDLRIVSRSLALPLVSRCSPTVSEVLSCRVQRMTVAKGVNSGPRFLYDGRLRPSTWLRRGTISSRMSRSLPLTTKKPPHSSCSSPCRCSCSGVMLHTLHRFERTITGRRPILRTYVSGSSSPTCRQMTALSAARYVRFRSRHSAGYMSLTSSAPVSIRKGWPRLTDWIHTFTGGPVPPSPLSSSTCSRLATSESRPSSRNWLYESTCGEKSDSRFACTSAELGSAFTPLKCRSGFAAAAGAIREARAVLS